MPETPRIAHLVIALDHGGLERCVVLWTAARNRRFQRSTLIACLDDSGALAATLPAGVVHPLRARRRRFPWDRKAVRALRTLLIDQHIRIVHSHNTAARFYAALAVRSLPVRHLYTDHGTNPHLHGWRSSVRLHFMKAHTDRCIAVSEPAAHDLAAAARCPLPSVIANGIAASPTGNRSLRSQLGIPETTFVIGFAGRLAPEKGVDRLLRVVPCLPPDCRLVILGTGPAEADLKRQCADLPNPGQITFLGSVDDARMLMPAFDLMVLPSRSEGLPLALIEAMAEGVPVAVTAVGQCPRVIENGAYGLLLPARDALWPSLLASEIRAIRDGQRESVRATAQRHITRHYNMDLTLDLYEANYRALVQT